jgi:hypothetical protein
MLCAALAGAALVAGCGGGGDSNQNTGITEIAPADASLYADAVIRPSGDQKSSLDSFLSTVLNTNDPGAKITELIDKAFKDNGETKTFAADVDPWLGDDAGVFTVGFENNPPALAAVQSDDPQAGVQLLESESPKAQKQTYKGVPYEIDENGDAFGAIGDFVAQGDPSAFTAAVDASKGNSLADSQRFKDAVKDVPSDALGRIYGDVKGLIGQVAQQQGVPAGTVEDLVSKLGVEGTFVASAEAGDKSVSLDLHGLGGAAAAQPPTLLGDLPADAWLAFGISDVGAKLKSIVDEIESAGIPGVGKGTIAAAVQSQANLDINADVFPWLGDAALFVRGTDPANLDGALVIQSNDEFAAARTVNVLREIVQSQGTPQPLDLGSGGNGFKLVSPSAAQPINFVRQPGKVVIGYGDAATQEALTPARTLGDSPSFTAASGSLGDNGPAFFISAEQAVNVLAASSASTDPTFQKIAPYLQRLSFLTAGGGDGALKIVLGAK